MPVFFDITIVRVKFANKGNPVKNGTVSNTAESPVGSRPLCEVITLSEALVQNSFSLIREGGPLAVEEIDIRGCFYLPPLRSVGMTGSRFDLAYIKLTLFKRTGISTNKQAQEQ